jgi:hypothetical protein
MIMFNKDMKRIEQFNNCTWHHVKNYLQVDANVEFVGVIDSDEQLDGEILVENNVALFGKTNYKRKLREYTVNFDHVMFDLNPDLINSEEYLDKKSEIIQNLIHIYNGGTVETVPYPMPLTRISETIDVQFIKDKEIPITVYSKQEVIDQFTSKLK